MIERYLDDLARRLSRLGRRRILSEVEDHLRASAAEHGEQEAIRRFGPVDEIAKQFRPDGQLRLGRLVLAAAVASMLAVVLAVEWGNAVPGTPGWLPVAGVPPGLLAAAALYVATAPRAQAWK